MLTDLQTVMRKELRELLMPDGRFQAGARNLVILIAIAGVLFPLQAGASWLSSWLSVYSACFPAILLLNYAADAFAGERERHTLETLVATRLPDRAILFGKILAITLYGWGLILAGQVVAVVALSIVHGRGRVLFFAPGIFASILVVGLLLPLLLTTASVLVSMTAPTVRAAGQRMLVPFLAIYALPSFVPLVARQLHWTISPVVFSPARVVVGIAVVCAVASAVMARIALALFKREKLALA